MRLILFSAKEYDVKYFTEVNKKYNYHIHFSNEPLNKETAHLAEGFDAVCIFVNDDGSEDVLRKLRKMNVNRVLLRCAGDNNVDLAVAESLNLSVRNVPDYSPVSIAEYSVALMLSLYRKLPQSFNRSSRCNFSLNGLSGLSLSGKKVGVIGTGRIGLSVCRILRGFSVDLMASDPVINPDVVRLGAKYVELSELFKECDIITLHCPAVQANKHLLNEKSFSKMKDGVMIINTSRGELIDTQAAIDALTKGKIGFLGVDVYEKEAGLFFRDASEDLRNTEEIRRLISFENVILTGHQAFLSEEALMNIATKVLDYL